MLSDTGVFIGALLTGDQWHGVSDPERKSISHDWIERATHKPLVRDIILPEETQVGVIEESEDVEVFIN